jgi:uncharacterized membrane protein (UPF0182 family)
MNAATPGSTRRRRILWLAALVLGLWTLAGAGTRLIVDALWFGELGYVSVFRTRILTQVVLAGAGFAIAFTALFVTLRLALRRSPLLRLGPRTELDLALWSLERRATALVLGLAALIAVGLAGALAREWSTFLAFVHRVPYGLADPIFDRDVGFYLFTLPALRAAHGWLTVVVVVAGFATAGLYALRGGLVDRHGIRMPVRLHLGVFAQLLLLLLAAHFFLAQYDVLRSTRGVVFGAGYTDVNAALPGVRVLIVATIAAAAALAYGIGRGRLLWAGSGPLGLLIVYVLAAVGTPGTLQKLVVEPNEFVKERPYIEHALRFTREAYDLDGIETAHFDASANAGAEIVASHRAEIENIRLWDYRLLLPTYRQLQEIRLYYNFGDVDVDRYVLDGRYRQVMLSARELAHDQIPEEARTWVNNHLIYTHGYGLCMSPVNEITPEGLPELLVRDIPPQMRAETGLRIDRPEIYFGEQTTTFSLVLTSTDEFDYPVGETNRFTRYAGAGGIGVGSFARRVLFAWHLRSRELLFTNYLRPDSRILLYRTLAERVGRIAPFLRYDHDPYVVIADGRLKWIVDAYTVSDRFPYSRPLGAINYIRNAVKVVIDAYDGTCDFYVADPDDPVLRTYQGMFPTLFQPLEAMPAALRQHLRYPEDLFRLQAEAFAAFHMQDPQVFYNKEDLWQVPVESFANREMLMEPYYTIMRLGPDEEPEFVLMLPFTPSRKDNMIAWMAARCDGDNLGRRVVFLFPKQELVYGPRQIEARIDQDAVISQQITLWSQRGSQVIRGNLLVIPIGRSLLYVEPLYLQAEKGALPELKRVILANGNRIAMDVNLDRTLAALFAGSIPLAAPEAAAAGLPPSLPAGLPADTARGALEILGAADAALRRGDWAAYGTEMTRLRQFLEARSVSAATPARTP